MDTVTQALLGMAVGQAVFGRRLRGQALLWGAVGGALPDLDTLVAAPFGSFATLVHHRGISHSLLFGPVVGSLLGYAFWRRRVRHPVQHSERLIDWMGLWVLAIVTHPLLDLFTTYGTQLLAPLSNHRFAVNGIGILDPIYTLLLLVAVVVGVVTLRRPFIGKWAAWAALGLTSCYLVYGVYLNHVAARLARDQLRAENVHFEQIRAYPTVLQLWLRRVVATSDREIRVGYVSMWAPGPIEWFVAPRRKHERVSRLLQSKKGRIFAWFAQGMVAGRVEPGPQGVSVVEVDDIRYGLPPMADRGFWGIRARYGPDGSLVGDVERFRRPLPLSGMKAIRHLVNAARGYDPCTFRVGVTPGSPPVRC